MWISEGDAAFLIQIFLLRQKKFWFYSTVSTFTSAKAKFTSAFALAIAECQHELEWLGMFYLPEWCMCWHTKYSLFFTILFLTILLHVVALNLGSNKIFWTYFSIILDKIISWIWSYVAHSEKESSILSLHRFTLGFIQVHYLC